jgi:hypothetical protein
MEELQDKTVQWAKDRGIVPNATAQTQFIKLISEAGELERHYANGESIKDDIGDCLVVLAIIAELTSTTIDFRKHIPISGVALLTYLGLLGDNLLKGKDVAGDIYYIINILYAIALTRDLTLEECWYHSYQEIKDRKGIMTKDGVFIKESDPAYTLITEVLGKCDRDLFPDISDIRYVIDSKGTQIDTDTLSLEQLHELVVKQNCTPIPF